MRNIFVKRNCFTLSRPINDERLLRKIDQIEYGEVEDKFKLEINKLITYVLSSAEVKRINNVPLKGEQFVDYLELMMTGI